MEYRIHLQRQTGLFTATDKSQQSASTPEEALAKRHKQRGSYGTTPGVYLVTWKDSMDNDMSVLIRVAEVPTSLPTARVKV